MARGGAGTFGLLGAAAISALVAVVAAFVEPVR
jgi:hypothetical protein